MKKILCTLSLVTSLIAQTSEKSMQDFYNNKQVLVTGGCGFIGSHLVHTLVKYGAKVTVLDNLDTGFLRNIASVKDKITFIQGSVADMDVCLQATKNKSHIFHLAAFISVPLSVEEPAWCHRSNVEGTFNLLEAARINGVKRFVFSSSSAVYGAPDGPCSEDGTCKPTSPYAISKLIGEHLLNQYAINYDMECVSMRYFNVYGERQNPNAAYAAVVAKFRDLMQHNKQVTIFGDGQQTRDFIPVKQVVHTNLFLGMAVKEDIQGEVFNVATGRSITVLDLFDELKAEFPDYAHEPNFAPPRVGDLKHSTANCNKLQNLLCK